MLLDTTKGPAIVQLQEMLRDTEDWESRELLSDLAHPEQDHRWLWGCAPPSESSLSRREFREAVLLHLGGIAVTGRVECAFADGVLGPQGRDTLRCAPGKAMRPHNRIHDMLHGLACMSDGNAVTEASGLIASAPHLRPADLLTHAAFGRQTTFDNSMDARSHHGKAPADEYRHPSRSCVSLARTR